MAVLAEQSPVSADQENAMIESRPFTVCFTEECPRAGGGGIEARQVCDVLGQA